MANNHVRAVDGSNGGAHAPRPKRKGWSQAIYDVVDANRGWSTIKSIRELLPAALDSDQLIPKKEMERHLYQAVYQGWVIENEGRYHIAPMAFYKNRQKAIEAAKGTGHKRKNIRKESSTYSVRPFWHWNVLGMTFLLGTLLGLVVGDYLS